MTPEWALRLIQSIVEIVFDSVPAGRRGEALAALRAYVVERDE